MEKFLLNDGAYIPQFGIGGFAQSSDSIEYALNLGYRLIDTASQYGNEEQVGEAIRKSGVSREEIFLTTKLWTEDVRNGNTREALLMSLKKLQTDYIDLYLIHWPADGYEKAYLDMLDLKREGLIRSVGVSNFHKIHLDRLTNITEVIPAANQIESHPYFNNQSLINLCKDRGILAEVWCPLGGAYGSDLNDGLITKLARKYNKTPAQIIIRWHIQRGVVLFPKSSNLIRMKSNIEVYDFVLEKSEIDSINSLDTGKRIGPDPEEFDF